MEILIVLLIMAVWLAAILFAVRGAKRKEKRVEGSSLLPVAPAYGGDVRVVDGREILFLERAGFRATLDVPWPGTACFTAVPQGRFAGHLHVAPETLAGSMSRLFGGQDLDVGDREFDALYVVRARPPEFARAALVPDVRGLIRSLGWQGEVRLSVSPSRLELRFTLGSNEPVGRAAFDKLVSCGLQIAEAIPRVEPGIVVIETKLQVSGTACQICGTPLEGALVECTRCTTLHHADCWEYNGRCSTFACGSLASRKAELRGR
ncbi:MAG: hypothetical protein HYY17_07575 [Planctomycetes bacterium]|nr:hypothetical protein [Planctomycetota bacterium]